MGLDMYAVARRTLTKEEKVQKLIDMDVKPEEVELCTWRKHNALHGFMENIWLAKEGEEYIEFNCVPVYLDEVDLLELKNLIESEELYSMGTNGFFFGSSNYDQEDIDHHKPIDMQFVNDALGLIEEGYVIEYSSWW